MNKRHLIIATRESPLALWQAESIKAQLIAHYPTLVVTLLGITTQGDKRLDVALAEIGGKGLFVKELEEALLDGRADIAVHSMKDVPMELPAGLSLPVICAREEPRDVFVSNRYASLAELPFGARIGTSSLRRQMQLAAYRPDLLLMNLRGNIQTRLKRLDEERFDGLMLAAAGLIRMGLVSRIKDYLPFTLSLPAAGQGALGIECRENDHVVKEMIAILNDPPTAYCVSAERALCRRLEGGCKVPLAAFAEIQAGQLWLRGLVGNREGTLLLRAEQIGELDAAEAIGLQVAEALLAQGADTILRQYKC